jgi:hypothetical protein
MHEDRASWGPENVRYRCRSPQCPEGPLSTQLSRFPTVGKGRLRGMKTSSRAKAERPLWVSRSGPLLPTVRLCSLFLVSTD